MDPLHGLALGVVQALAEFLPISSSAHLIVVPWLLGWPPHSLTFDVALHMGTLAALLGYFWRDWWTLAAAWLPERSSGGASGRALEAEQQTEGPARGADDERKSNRRLGIGLVVGTVPAGIAGLLLVDVIEESLRAPVLIALVMLGASAVILAADRLGARTLHLSDVTIGRAAILGLAQAVALVPGVSRSGITLAAALFLGMTREAGARYAFLLAAPITAAAGVFQLRHLLRDGIPADERLAFALGIAASFLVGLLAIGSLLRYLRHRSLSLFVGYRVLAALLVLAVGALRG